MYLAEARERGIPVLPPDINESELNFSVERGKGVRFGLTAIKGLGEGAINSILLARAQLGGRIPSLHALCEILDLRLANKQAELTNSQVQIRIAENKGDADLAVARKNAEQKVVEAEAELARSRRQAEQTVVTAQADRSRPKPSSPWPRPS